MKNDIDITFGLEIVEDTIIQIKPSKENEYIALNYKPFFIVGFSANINYTPISIPLDAVDNRKFKLRGDMVNKKSKLRPDTKILFHLIIYDEDSIGHPIRKRISEWYVNILDLLQYKQINIDFLDAKKQQQLSIKFNRIDINYNEDSFLKSKSYTYYTENNIENIRNVLQEYFDVLEENKQKYFTKYISNTSRIGLEKVPSFLEDTCFYTYMYSKLNRTNEEFWENILYKAILTAWIESGMEFKIKDVDDDKTFRENMDYIFSQFPINVKIGVLTTMLTIISNNSIYETDYIRDKNLKTIVIDDWYMLDLGAGDCEEMGGSHVKKCLTYFQSVKCKNEILLFFQKLLDNYIYFMCIVSSYAKSATKWEGSNTKFSCHMCSCFILKHWLFKSETKNENVLGKIGMNPGYINKSDGIKNSLSKIIEHETKNGRTLSHINDEKLPSFFGTEGTNEFSPIGEKNNQKKEYDMMDYAAVKIKEELYEAMRYKQYAYINDDKIFYKYFHLFITDFFVKHPIYPSNLPSFSATRDDYNSDGYFWGVSYPEVVMGYKGMLLIADVPFENFSDMMDISKSLEQNTLISAPMYLTKDKNQLIFEPYYYEEDEEFNLIETEISYPMLNKKIIAEIDIDVLKNVNIIMQIYKENKNKNVTESKYFKHSFNSLDSTNYLLCDLINKFKGKILCYSMYMLDMQRFMVEFFKLFKNNNFNLLSIQRFDIAYNISFYKIFIAITPDFGF